MNRSPATLTLPFFALSLFVSTLFAEDWPTFRHDHARSAVSSEAFTLPLHHSWTHTPAATPTAAWPLPARQNISAKSLALIPTQRFDAAFHAIAAGGRLFYGSSATDTLTCLDFSGQERWTFITEGPIRIAPCFNDGRIYVGSDDGTLYCLNADDGSLLWTYRPGPKDSRLPGNGRIISMWPIRCGIVVDAGSVYITAGIFPSQGVYLCSVDAATGKEQWKETLSAAPQGYLLATKDVLYAPTGRTPFQAYDRATGKPIGKMGSSKSWGKRLVGGSFGVVIDDKLASGPSEDGAIDIFENRKSILRTLGKQLLASGDHAYLLNNTKLEAFDLASYIPPKEARRGKGISKPTWTLACEIEPHCMAMAKNIIFIGANKQVSACDASTGKEVWKADVDGRVESMVLSDGQLFVCSDTGQLYAFSPTKPSRPPAPATAKAQTTNPYTTLAKSVLEELGSDRGYAFVLGLETGEWVAALAQNSNLRLIGIDPDPEKVTRARRLLTSAGLYGTHAVIHQHELDALPYGKYIANLVTSETALMAGHLPPSASESARLLRPHGGLLHLAQKNKSFTFTKDKAWNDWVEHFPKLKVRRKDKLRVAYWLRPALPGAGEWSHFYGDSANTACSQDQIRSGPMDIQWFGRPGPHNMVDRHNKAPAPLYKNGRLIVTGLDYFVAADAYNGTILWEKNLPHSARIGAMKDSSNMVIADDALYIAAAGNCLRLDPQTGRELGRLSIEALFDDKKSEWGYLAANDGILFGTATRSGASVRAEKPSHPFVWGTAGPLVCSDSLFAVSPEKEKARWRYQPSSGVIINTTLTVADGHIYFVQSDNPESLKPTDGRVTLKVLLKSASLVALNAKTGKQAWKQPLAPLPYRDIMYMSYGSETLILTGSNYRSVSKAARQGRAKPNQEKRLRYGVIGIDANRGNTLWEKEFASNRDHILDGNHGENIQHPAIVGEIVYGPGFAFHLRDGKPYKGWQWEQSHKCGTISTSRNTAFSRFSAEKLTYSFDLETGRSAPLTTTSRPGCWINTIPAGGLVLIPEASAGCTCEYSNQTSMALVPRLEAPTEPNPAPEH